MTDRGPPRRMLLRPLGDRAVLAGFDRQLSEAGNRAAVAFAERLETSPPPGVVEIVPSLVSVLVRFDPAVTTPSLLMGELRLIAPPDDDTGDLDPARQWTIPVRYGGPDAPHLDEAAAACGLSAGDFIAAHAAARLRVLATGFAPGFVYCGLHTEALTVPRRQTVRDGVAAGAILFAAGQTAITATAIRTGWHVIGRTDFRNFDPKATPPTQLRAGDAIAFEALA